MSDEDMLPQYSAEYPTFTRAGYIRLSSPDGTFVGYLVQEDIWADDKRQALPVILESPKVASSSTLMPRAIQIADGKDASTLRVLGPRRRKRHIFDDSDQWAIDNHLTNLGDRRIYCALTECWLVLGDELRLIWRYDDQSRDLLNVVKIKDTTSVPGNLAFKSSASRHRGVQLRMTFEEDPRALEGASYASFRSPTRSINYRPSSWPPMSATSSFSVLDLEESRRMAGGDFEQWAFRRF